MSIISIDRIRRTIRSLGIPIIGFFLCAPSTAQIPAYHFEHLSIDDGLSQNFVNVITQDHRGFMWFGTNDGLNRYDGNEFRPYYYNVSDSTSLLSNSVTALFEDSRHNLWIGAGGLNRYDRLHDCFERVLHPADFSGRHLADHILDIVEDHRGDLWIAVEKAGLYRLEWQEAGNAPGDGKTVEGAPRLSGPYPFTNRQEDAGYPVIKKLLIAGNSLWVSHEKGISRLEASGNGPYPLPGAAEFTDPIPSFSTTETGHGSLFADKSGNIWIGISGGLIRAPASGRSADIRFFPYPDGWFAEKWMGIPKNMVADPDGNLWIATFYGLVVFKPATGSFQHITRDPQDPSSLPFNGLTNISIDAGNIIWLGAGGQGIAKFASQGNPFRHYLGREREGDAFSTYNILEDGRGDLWLSTAGGYFDQFRRHPETEILQPGGRFWGRNVMSNMLLDREGTIWMVSNHLLISFDPGTGRKKEFPLLSRYNDNFQTYIPDSIPVLYLDREDSLWICNTSYLYHFLPATETFSPYEMPVKGLGQVNTFLKDDHGRFWLATRKGLLVYQPNTGEWQLFQADPDQEKGLKNNQVNCLLPDPVRPERFLWVGTGGGLHRLDKEAGTFEVYTTADGLPNNYIYGILADEANRLWISTNNGLSCLDPADGRFENYDVEDGLQSNEFNTGSYFKSRRGELFFGGINGLTAFFPDQIIRNSYVPPVVLTDFQLSYESVRHGTEDSPLAFSITETKEIRLSHRQRTLAFEFAALDFTRSQNNSFRYMLEGFDQDWIDAGTNNQATYTNLPPGDFTFRVQGANNDGVFNEEGASVRLVIAYPPWQRWWAYLLYALAAALAGYVAYRYFAEKRHMRLEMWTKEQEARRLAELDQFKSRFFANISHEFRTPIALVQGQVDGLLSELKRSDLRERALSIKQNSGQLLRLIDQLLDIARLESDKMKFDLKTGDLVFFTQKLVEVFQPLAAQRGIELTFSSEHSQLLAQFDPDALQKILQNLITNALKFTESGGAVRVRLTKTELPDPGRQEERILIEVIDEGVGIPEKDLERIFDRYYQADQSKAAGQGFGLGLALARELTVRHGGTIRVESDPDGSSGRRGSKFTVDLPGALLVGAAAEADLQPVVHPPLPEPELPDAAAGGALAGNDQPWAALASNQILVVEDHAELREFIRGILEPEYRVILAENGRKGLEAALAEIPDLIISDIMMPGMDGYELIRRLTADQRSSHIPVILLTARAETKDRLQGLELGADDYLVKPFQKEELLIRIRNIIRRRELLKEKNTGLVLGDALSDDLNSTDQAFLQKVLACIEADLEDEQFGVEVLAGKLNMSSSNLYRKLQALIEMTPVQLIQLVRFKKAAQLLKKGYNVSEVAYQVGYRNQSYFSASFKKHYGCTPREYASGG